MNKYTNDIQNGDYSRMFAPIAMDGAFDECWDILLEGHVRVLSGIMWYHTPVSFVLCHLSFILCSVIAFPRGLEFNFPPFFPNTRRGVNLPSFLSAHVVLCDWICHVPFLLNVRFSCINLFPASPINLNPQIQDTGTWFIWGCFSVVSLSARSSLPRI